MGKVGAHVGETGERGNRRSAEHTRCRKIEPDAGFPAARLAPLAPRGCLGGPARLRTVEANLGKFGRGATGFLALLLFFNDLIEFEAIAQGLRTKDAHAAGS